MAAGFCVYVVLLNRLLSRLRQWFSQRGVEAPTIETVLALIQQRGQVAGTYPAAAGKTDVVP